MKMRLNVKGFWSSGGGLEKLKFFRSETSTQEKLFVFKSVYLSTITLYKEQKDQLVVTNYKKISLGGGCLGTRLVRIRNSAIRKSR